MGVGRRTGPGPFPPKSVQKKQTTTSLLPFGFTHSDKFFGWKEEERKRKENPPPPFQDVALTLLSISMIFSVSFASSSVLTLEVRIGEEVQLLQNGRGDNNTPHTECFLLLLVTPFMEPEPIFHTRTRKANRTELTWWQTQYR